MAKKRVDVYLVESGFFTSREKAQKYIMAGVVIVDDMVIMKTSDKIDVDKEHNIRLKKDIIPYVSRGGLKLEKAIKIWKLDFNDKYVLDVGSSTGGFTDCSLQNGAKEVSALDVGTNQLVYSLRTHKQVKVYEQTNFRTIEEDFFPQKFDIVVMDVSFISTKLLFPNVYNNLKDDGFYVCLIKPQFEAGRDVKRNNKGVITDKTEHVKVIMDVINNANAVGLHVNKLSTSPIKGGEGNVEYLALIEKEQKNTFNVLDVEKIVGV